MSQIKANKIQAGISITPGNNFVLDASSDDGSLILRDSSGTAILTLASGGTAQIFAKENILGTVSQSAGVPTGSIIEKGSNGNGEYVKFADGTLICKVNILLSTSADVTWYFPATFSEVPRVYGTAASGANNVVVQGRIAGKTVSSVPLAGFTGSTGGRLAASTDVMSIGRWF